ncbi:MAG: hypothetical protein KBF82_13575 [Chitinophagaceae bacterium]|nr:hypothetical protein [Chitinophagaceae bacterium]MBP9104890.1 hypothetical protein [Chitinophagaceae bacterium]
MLKQEQHKRFINMNEMLLSSRCYWYAQLTRTIVPIGNDNNSIHQRPDYVHT